MEKKIYFAGSIRGGRVDASLYARMIELLKRYAIVLTEHVGSSKLCLNEQAAGGDVSIFRQDMGWLEQCHMVVAECTCPSLGVGYELARAETLGKPVHIYYNRSRTQLSAMLTGNAYFHIHPYDTEDQLLDSITALMQSL